MFDNDYKLLPRTYSIKSYRKRETFKFKKYFMYLTCIVLMAAILGITFLSITRSI